MAPLTQTCKQLYRQLDGIFTAKEAWTLFKVSAILETIGWTLLIIGIVFDELKWPLHGWILPLGGSIHGIFVIGYMFIVFFAHRSMKWSAWRMLVGEAVSVIPYGALVFEQWAIRHRRSHKR